MDPGSTEGLETEADDEHRQVAPLCYMGTGNGDHKADVRGI